MLSVGRYQLLDTLGEGGMGVVYKAFDPLIQRTVAVKLISARLAESPELRQRFFSEARAAGQLSHRNIVTIFDLGEDDGHPYFAMEYLEGRNLRVRMQSFERMSLGRKIEIMGHLCDGLAYAHSKGVTHRDIKPANVFITDAGEVKVLDFGLARLPASELTHSKTFIGTLNYMAPEQIAGEKTDHRTDIFAVGVVFYEMLSGRSPFEADSVAALLNKILREEAQPLGTLEPGMPPELNALGTFVRSTQSFGPILSDRAETIGRGRFSFGFTSQFFSFDTLEGVDLADLPALFTHDDAQLGGGRADVVTTANTIEASVAQMTSVVSYGVTNRVDMSLAVPVVTTRLSVRSFASIHRIGTAESPAAHFFRDVEAPGTYGTDQLFTSSGSASGLGDLILRVKGTILREAQRGLAVGLETRFPTGDERNLLGLGAWGAKPFVAFSASFGHFSPHANFGYQWNGESLLAGDLLTGRKARLPGQALYAAGLDVGVHPRLTLALDLLGQRVIDSPRLQERTFTSSVSGEQFPDIAFSSTSYSVMTGSAGFKVNFAGRLLGIFNVRFHLGSGGLADRATPLLGVEYGF